MVKYPEELHFIFFLKTAVLLKGLDIEKLSFVTILPLRNQI
jgi:hypothetical protein